MCNLKPFQLPFGRNEIEIPTQLCDGHIVPSHMILTKYPFKPPSSSFFNWYVGAI